LFFAVDTGQKHVHMPVIRIIRQDDGGPHFFLCHIRERKLDQNDITLSHAFLRGPEEIVMRVIKPTAHRVLSDRQVIARKVARGRCV
jgi:hypothetical protein